MSAETVGLFHDGELGSIPQRWLARARDLPSSKSLEVLKSRLQVKYRTLEVKCRKAA